VRQRDAVVAKVLTSISPVRCVVVMAGGYGADEDIIPLHLGTLEAFATTRVAPRRQPHPNNAAHTHT